MNLYEELSKHYAECAARRDQEKDDRAAVFKRIQDNLGKELGCGYDPRIKVEGEPDGTCTAHVGFIFSKTAQVSVEFTIEKVADGFAVKMGHVLHDVSTDAGWSALWPSFYQALRHQVDESFHEEARKKKEEAEHAGVKKDGDGKDAPRTAAPNGNGARDAKKEPPKNEQPAAR